METWKRVKGRFLFEREYVGYTGSLTHIARGIDRLAREGETGEWIGVDGVWDAFVEQVLRPIEKLELAAQGEKGSQEDGEKGGEEEMGGEKWGEEGEREAPATLSLTVKPPVTEIMEETTRDPAMEARKKGGGTGGG